MAPILPFDVEPQTLVPYVFVSSVAVLLVNGVAPRLETGRGPAPLSSSHEDTLISDSSSSSSSSS